MIKAFIFDMDGVITETSEQHFLAWKTLAAMLGINFDKEFNENLKGISRLESMKRILEYGNMLDKYSLVEIEKMTFLKNEYYKNLISDFKPENVFDGVVELFRELKIQGLKIAIGSASYNAPTLIKSMKLENYVDYIVNPGEVDKGKPAPDIFLKAAERLGVNPQECIGVEDALAGVKAIKSAGMYAIGIGDKEILKEADIVFEHIGEVENALGNIII